MQQLRAQALKLDKPGFKSRLRLRVHQLCVLGKFSTGQRLILFFCGAVMVTTAPPLGGPGRALRPGVTAFAWPVAAVLSGC